MFMCVLSLMRDLLKSIYLSVIQVVTRLSYIEREFPSSISLSTVLDVIPRAKQHRSHHLVLRKKAYIEKWCVVNTWHGDVILEKGAGTHTFDSSFNYHW